MAFTSISMKMVKIVALFLFLFLIFGESTPTQLPESVKEVSDAEKVSDASSPLKVELDELKSKISLLESSLNEKVQELHSKEKALEELNKINEEKSQILTSLQREVLLLKDKVSSNAKNQEDEAHGRATKLQEQFNSLKKEIEALNKNKDALEAKTISAEKKVQDLNLKLENLRQSNDEQQSQIRKTQRALEVAEEKLMKAKTEADSLAKQLMEVQNAWIPTWFSLHYDCCKSFVMTHWDKHGRPYWDLTIKKVLETKFELEKWAEPHVDAFKTKWFPIVKERCLAAVNDFGVQLQSLASKANDAYHTSKKTLEPHVVRTMESLDPHIQEAKKLAKPYVDQVSTQMKPHVDKARVFLKPYTEKVILSSRKFMKVVGIYRQQVSYHLPFSLNL
ncbi:OLC1v1035947C2 [Oldenlandia corymbosa var. corymbosa]|uniref:OLC1v1035947C2 n=1 Tax=Oldenlandia corymbosa var. corymbosa TaxID=529605 RepID=A0AAV1CUU8_OLDCO|nr:OLC1v1035947C2 [Oldenlandia corymbosa var. corymbosa]